ncbi:MAG: aldo/keto reductase [Alphaproteobacteria bacterium]|nr:aldo/keto reductase [Alphaproteobacteria bacterium]
MILQDTYTLANGVEIPKLGLGTWMITNDTVAQAVVDAVALGYRHIDTAQAYQNEAGVGEGIRTAGIPREQIFVTTKLAAEAKTYDEAAAAIDGSIEALGLDVIDLMIIHSPQPWMKFGDDEDRCFEGNREAWRALEDAYKAGKLRAIGLSNFNEADLDNILSSATVTPMVNQVLAHIGNTPFELIEYATSKGILTEAYSPIAHGALLGHDAVSAMADKYGVSVPQLSIRYTLQLGLLPLPKTANPAHMKSNAALDFTISDEDMAVLKAQRVVDYGEANMFPVYGGKL